MLHFNCKLALLYMSYFKKEINYHTKKSYAKFANTRSDPQLHKSVKLQWNPSDFCQPLLIPIPCYTNKSMTYEI